MRPRRSRPASASWRAAVLLAAIGAPLLGLVSCRPLYLPPVPPRTPVHEVAQLGDASSLQLVNGNLRLHVVLQHVPHAGWMAVQWFAPDGREAASDSVWVTPSDAGQGRTLELPKRVTLAPGEWRAVVSLGKDVLRQFRRTIETTGSSAPAP